MGAFSSSITLTFSELFTLLIEYMLTAEKFFTNEASFPHLMQLFCEKMKSFLKNVYLYKTLSCRLYLNRSRVDKQETLEQKVNIIFSCL